MESTSDGFGLIVVARSSLAYCELLHPSWRRTFYWVPLKLQL